MGKQDGSGRHVTVGDVDDSGTPFLNIDMDAFFASVEELDDPSLRGTPVIVGGSAGRGVVSAANYAARAYGVNSAMPMSIALRRCPHATVRRPRFERYSQISRQVFDIFRTFTPLVQPLSIDEAFLDVSGARELFGSPQHIAQLIRDAVREQVGLTCSVGVASSMFVAKVASSRAKPDGLLVVPAPDTQSFLAGLPISALWGVGPVTAKRLANFGVLSISDVQTAGVGSLTPILGERMAQHIHNLALGIDPRAVSDDRRDKSIGHSSTFHTDLTERADCDRAVLRFATDVSARLRAHGLVAHTVVLTVRFGDWTTITRSHTMTEPTDVTKRIADEARHLLSAVSGIERGVRLLGVRVENLVGDRASDVLWDDPDEWRTMDEVVDAVAAKFGRNTVTPASLLRPRGTRRASGEPEPRKPRGDSAGSSEIS